MLIDNKRVRMIEGVLKPGEKEGKHSHPVHIFYALNAFRCVSRFQEKTAEAEYKGGEAVWREAVTHFGENIGESNARFLIIEFKNQNH